MRVLTFSTKFPGYHPRKGEPTHFIEQVLRGLSIPDYWDRFYEWNNGVDIDQLHHFQKTFFYPASGIKYHTIRGGNRWKVGDKFSARIWSGKPYRSKQIEFAQLEVKKVYNMQIDGFLIWINKQLFSWHSHSHEVEKLAKNDGLTVNDFWDWFPQKNGHGAFKGQIICFTDKVRY